jgi:hypothetical protein
MMEAVLTSETSVHSNEITRHYIPEDYKLNVYGIQVYFIKCAFPVLCYIILDLIVVNRYIRSYRKYWKFNSALRFQSLDLVQIMKRVNQK